MDRQEENKRESYEGLVPGLLADDEYGEPETQIIYLPAAWSGSFLDYIDGQIQQTARYKEETSIVELGENSPDPELPACVSPTSHQLTSLGLGSGSSSTDETLSIDTSLWPSSSQFSCPAKKLKAPRKSTNRKFCQNFPCQHIPGGNASPGTFNGTRRTYAELCELAIKSAPEEKSMLRDIYTWMQEHVPEFNDDHPHALNQESWKNSVRHNLSLHKKFRRIPNEGKLPWFWTVVDPNNEAKQENLSLHGIEPAKYCTGYKQ